jgi:sugar-specific transcriptional regulator TrmB
MSETMHLREMGLSEYEARAYVSLYRQGTSTAKEIASRADIPQSRVYDVLDSLETKGFAVVQPGRPKKFGPVDPETALEQFCNFKQRGHTSELEQIRDLGEEFVEEINDVAVGQTDQREIDVGWSYPNRHYILEQLERLTGETESEILMMSTPTSFERIVNHHGDLLERKSQTGVGIRALVADDRTLTDPIRRRATELMDIRRVEDICGRLYMYDGENILLAYHAMHDDGFVGISTASSHLYATLEHLFDVLWEDGTTPVEA